MRKSGIVKTGGEWATVSILRASSCGENCAMCKGGCTPSETEIKARNTIDAKTGDRVVLEIDDKNGLKAVFLAYIVPLIAFLVSSVIFTLVGFSDGISLILGVLVMLLIYLLIRRLSLKKSDDFSVKIISRIG